jgi:hypothetical protein
MKYPVDFALEIDMETGKTTGFGKTAEHLPGESTGPEGLSWQDFLQRIEENRREELAEFVERGDSAPLPGITATFESAGVGRIKAAFTRFVYADDEELSHYRLLLCEVLSG